MESRREFSYLTLVPLLGSAGCIEMLRGESNSPEVTLCDLLVVNYSPRQEEVIVEIIDANGVVHEFDSPVGENSADKNWVSFEDLTPVSGREMSIRAKRRGETWRELELADLGYESTAVIVKISQDRNLSIFYSGNCDGE